MKEERFKIISRIAEGGIAEIFLVYDNMRSEEIAMKRLLERHCRNRRVIRMFSKEARLVSRLNHSNILKIYERGSDGNRPYVVMEYFKSSSLKDILKKNTFLELARILDILYQVGLALDYIHGCGIVHLDVKPANILVNEDSKVKLTDFGMATTIFRAKFRFGRHTSGTPSYMSPEQINGIVDRRSDIYSFGVTAYEVLAGRLPFAGESLKELLDKHLSSASPKPPSEFIGDIPPHLDKIILKCLEKNKENRYPDMTHLLADLSALR